MSTASLLAQDFDSESDDGVEFNPPPADESEDELEVIDDDTPPPKKPGRTDERQRPAPEEVDAESDDDDRKVPSRAKRQKSEDGQAASEEESVKPLDKPDDEGDAEADEDELDEEEEEEDDEEEISGHRRKRSKKRQVHGGLFDIEAEVDDQDEEIEDEEDELKEAEGFIDNTHPDDEAQLPASGDVVDDRQHRELDRRRELEAGLDAERQAEEYRKRYGRNRAVAADQVVVPKRLLLPSVDDPNIWGVRAKPGKEREVVFNITKRVEERANTKAPLTIMSAFERGGTMAGYVYVEARRKEDIMTALDGLSNVYPRTKMILVPIKEMPDLLRTKKSKDIEPGTYVRLKRGKYQGDLAQVEAVVSNGLEVELRLVPRLDYGLNEDANAPMLDGGAKGLAAKRKRAGAFGANAATRPPQRLFSEAEARKKHLKYLQTLGDKKWQYLGDIYKDGYLIKDFKIQFLNTEDVNPSLEEVTRFAAGAEDGTENLDLQVLAASLKASSQSAAYLPGDMVEVYDGEQQGVCGKARRVLGDIVTMTVTEGELTGQDIEVPVKGLRKRFREGDHVKVIGGSKYRDDVGMVVRISADKVTIVSDQTMQEITVFSKDLREASDSGRAGGIGLYDLHDLVQIDVATVGVVIKVDRESLRVLDQNGSTRTIMPSQVSNKLERRRHAVATDRNGSEIRNDDTVREVGGESKQGVILHIYRSFLFLHSREQTEDAGVFVARATNVATVAAKGGRVTGKVSSGPDLAKMNPALQRNGGANGTGGPMAPPMMVQQRLGRDKALGKTVTIRKGPHKGLLGIVKDTTDNEARVELHTKSKTITVAKDTLAFRDPLTGQSIDYASFSGGGRGGGGRGRGGGGYGGGGETPGYGGRGEPRRSEWEGSRTPMAASGETGRTPAWGAPTRTPAWQGGGRTPAWKQDAPGGRTPAYVGEGSRTVNPYNDGGRTAYGGGSKTPAWSSGAKTPFGGHGGSGGDANDAFSAGSKTPAYGGRAEDSWQSGSKTPAYGGQSDSWGSGSRTPAYGAPTPAAAAPTPAADSWASRGYDAPTPGVGITAPTPGALDAPTPGAYNSAPTPAAYQSAPTPAAAAAPTPRPSGWGGPGGNWGAAESAPTPAALSAPTPGASYGGRGAPTPAGFGNPETPGNWGEDGEGEDEDGPRYEESTP
ncbi:MAG: transcription elongation factor spt5 [Thelocarpon impressellum]|nr:MAG: transcription elongation factor spt5 [Thelocarpon impressellum]